MSDPCLIFYSDYYEAGYRCQTVYRSGDGPIVLKRRDEDGGGLERLSTSANGSWYVEVYPDDYGESAKWETILYGDGGGVIQRGRRVGDLHPSRGDWRVCLITRKDKVKKPDPTKYYRGTWSRVDREDHQYEGRAWAVKTERGLPRNATVRVKHRDGNHTTVMLKGLPTRTEDTFALYYKYTKLESEVEITPSVSIPFPSSEEIFRRDLRDSIKTLISKGDYRGTEAAYLNQLIDSTQPQETDMTGQQSKGKEFVDNAIKRLTSVDLKNPIVLLGIAYVAYSLLSEEEQTGLQEFLGGKVSKIRSIVALLTA